MPPKKNTKKLYYQFSLFPNTNYPKTNRYIAPVVVDKAIDAVLKLKIKGIKIVDVLGYDDNIYISVDSKLKEPPKIIEEYTRKHTLITDKIYFGWGINESNYNEHKGRDYGMFLLASKEYSDDDDDELIGYVTKTESEVKSEINNLTSIYNNAKTKYDVTKEEVKRFKEYVNKFDFKVLKPSFKDFNDGVEISAMFDDSPPPSKSRSPPKTRVSPTRKTPIKKPKARVSQKRKGKK